MVKNQCSISVVIHGGKKGKGDVSDRFDSNHNENDIVLFFENVRFFSIKL